MSDDKTYGKDDGEFHEGRDPVLRQLFGEDSKQGAFSDAPDEDDDTVDEGPVP